MKDRKFFRYVRVRFTPGGRLYTYRSSILCKPGDGVLVPVYGGAERKTVEVVESSADDHQGYPTASWVTKGQRGTAGENAPWPAHFRRRHEDFPNIVFYANGRRAQVAYLDRADIPPEHVMVSYADGEITNGADILKNLNPAAYEELKAQAYGAFYGGPPADDAVRVVFGGRLADNTVQCRCTVFPEVVQEPAAFFQDLIDTTQTACDLVKAKLGDREMTKQMIDLSTEEGLEALEKMREATAEQLTELDRVLGWTKKSQRLAAIEATLDRKLAAVEYRKRFDGIDGIDQALLDEAVSLNDEVHFGDV